MATKRKDKNRVVLKKGESYRESDGRYSYRWTDAKGKRHSVYAKKLDDLRVQETEIEKDILDGVKSEARTVTLNDIYTLWKDVKRGLKDTSYQLYCYVYDTYVLANFGKRRIASIKKSDVRRFYNSLIDQDGLSVGTVDKVHTIIHQLFSIAVEDEYIRANPSDNALRELKLARNMGEEKRRALTADQEKLFLDYMLNNPSEARWYPVFAVMVGSGLRVGEITGLRWQDIDMENNVIDVNHTLVYYDHRVVKEGEKKGSYFAINSTKTPASKRIVPMLDFVKRAFEMEKAYQEEMGIHCETVIDGYSGFIFLNRFACPHHQGSLNRAIRRIVRDCNQEQMDKGSDVLLPYFSCHGLRHTFATRMCENGVNIKAIQNILGHTDIATTMNIYTDATEDLKKKEFELLNTKYVY